MLLLYFRLPKRQTCDFNESCGKIQKEISYDVIISRCDAAGSVKRCFFESAGYCYGQEYML